MQTKTIIDGSHIIGLIILNLYKSAIAPSKYKTLRPNHVWASIKLSTSKITDNTAKTMNIGKDCRKLSPAEAILSDKAVLADISPPVYVH